MTQNAVYALNNTTPVKITPDGIHSGLDVTIQNINVAGYVYVGAEGMTTSDFGYRILPNHAISFEVPPNDSLFLLGSTNLSAAVIKLNLEK